MYIAKKPSDDAALVPYSWYKRFVVDGARSHELPADYSATLETTAAADDENHHRDRQKRALTCDDENVMSRPPVVGGLY